MFGTPAFLDALFMSLIIAIAAMVRKRWVVICIRINYVLNMILGIGQVIFLRFFLVDALVYIKQKIDEGSPFFIAFAKGLKQGLPASLFDNDGLKTSALIAFCISKIALPIIAVAVVFSTKGPLALRKDYGQAIREAPMKV